MSTCISRISRMTRTRTLLAIAVALSAGLLASCGDDGAVKPVDNPLCAFTCPGHLDKGNAAISGVPEADTYFEAVVAYMNAADQVSAALDNDLNALRGELGLAANASVGAEIKRLGQQNLAAGPTLVTGDAHCWVDTQTLIDIQTACEPALEMPMGIDCHGACRAEPGVDCGRLSTLECTQNASGGTCTRCDGTCLDKPDRTGKCAGKCIGTCSATCDHYTRDAQGSTTCAGACAGTCTGQCEYAIQDASCRGECLGTCVIESSAAKAADDCDGAIETRCQPMPGRVYSCNGACGGVFDPPRGKKAECQAAAQAQVSILARCDAPNVSVFHALDTKKPSAMQTRYVQGLAELERRLPGFLADVARAKLIKTVGQGLATASTAEVKDSFTTEKKATDLAVQTQVGLGCALAELSNVSTAIGPSERHLTTSLNAASDVLSALGVK